ILQHPQEQMLGADLVVAQGVCLVAGKLQGPLGEQRRAAQGRPHHPAPPPATSAGHPPGCLPDGPDAEGLLAVAPDSVQVDPEQLGGLALALDEGPEQDMLGAEVAVAVPPGFLPGRSRTWWAGSANR